MTYTTGSTKLDRLLGGGVRPHSASLLVGPGFLGKETLAHNIMLEALRKGGAAIYVATNACAEDIQAMLMAQEPSFAEAQSDGRAWIVDTYSVSVDADVELPQTSYVDSATDLNGLAGAIQKIQASLIKDHDEHVLVLDSASTLVMYNTAPATFRFLQILIGKARRAGATVLFMMDQGMHTEAELDMFKHLADGTIEVREDKDRPQLRVRGYSEAQDHGWIEFAFDATRFEVVGSLAAGRIH